MSHSVPATARPAQRRRFRRVDLRRHAAVFSGARWRTRRWLARARAIDGAMATVVAASGSAAIPSSARKPPTRPDDDAERADNGPEARRQRTGHGGGGPGRVAEMEAGKSGLSYGTDGEARRGRGHRLIESFPAGPGGCLGAGRLHRRVVRVARSGYAVTVCDAREVFARRSASPIRRDLSTGRTVLARVGPELTRASGRRPTPDHPFDPAVARGARHGVGYLGPGIASHTVERGSGSSSRPDDRSSTAPPPIGSTSGRDPRDRRLVCARSWRPTGRTHSTAIGDGPIHAARWQ